MQCSFLRLILVSAFQLYLILLCNGHTASAPLQEFRRDEVILPGWHEAPSSLDEYPVHSGKTIIDPWSYLQRLGLYKILLNATNDLMPMAGKSSHNEDFNFRNLLWGLPVQFSWQQESGRLQDFANVSQYRQKSKMASRFASNQQGEHCVSSRSWWASMNYYLSVIPFLGAVNSGIIVPPYPIQILKPNYYSEHFCTSIDECKLTVPVALYDWTDLFHQLLIRNIYFTDSNIGAPTFSPRKNNIVELMWKAHVSSLHSVIGNLSDVLSYMPKPEQKVGLSWANLVDYIADTRYDLDYNKTLVLNTLALPPRVLIDGDRVPFIKDISHASNFALWLMETGYDIDSKTDGALKRTWADMMCSKATQSEARYILENILLYPLRTLPAIVHLIMNSLKDCSNSP